LVVSSPQDPLPLASTSARDADAFLMPPPPMQRVACSTRSGRSATRLVVSSPQDPLPLASTSARAADAFLMPPPAPSGSNPNFTLRPAAADGRKKMRSEKVKRYGSKTFRCVVALKRLENHSQMSHSTSPLATTSTNIRRSKIQNKTSRNKEFNCNYHYTQEVGRLKSQNDRLEDLLAKKDKMQKKMDKENQAMRVEYQKTKEALCKESEAVDAVQAENATLKSENQEIMVELQITKEVLIEYKKESKAAAQELDAVKAENAALKSENQKIRAEHKKKKEALSEVSEAKDAVLAENVDLKRENEKIRVEHQKTKEALDEYKKESKAAAQELARSHAFALEQAELRFGALKCSSCQVKIEIVENSLD